MTHITLVSSSCMPQMGHFLQLGHSQLGNSFIRWSNESEQPRHFECPAKPQDEQVISSSDPPWSDLWHMPQILDFVANTIGSVEVDEFFEHKFEFIVDCSNGDDPL